MVMIIRLCDGFVWDEIQDLSSVVRESMRYIGPLLCIWLFWMHLFYNWLQESDYVDLRVFGSCLRDFDNINNVKWQFFNLRDYPQGIPISQTGLWSACDVGWGSSWVEILSSILRCRAVPASSKGIREFESHRRWPAILFFTTLNVLRFWKHYLE